jgi:lipoprotein-releasing system permease protein
LRSPGFQWFVAWRYLMARPRRVSGIILVFAAVFAAVAGGVGYATQLDPLTDEFIAASQPLPVWLTVGFGMALSLSTVLVLYAVIRLVTGPPPRRSPFFAALAGLAGLAQLAVASVLAASETGESAGLLDLPGLRDQSTAWLSPPVLVALAATAAAIAASLVIKREPARSSARRVALVAVATIPVALAHVYWWRMVDFARIELGGAGGAVSHHPPVVLTIVGGVAVALCTLSLVMLAIRYVFTFFTTVSMGGVAIGTMALVVTLSVMSGFESDLRQKILGSNAHVLITRHDEAPFTGYAKIMAVAADVPGVVAETPYLTSEVVIAGSSNYFNVVIKGVDPRSIARVTDLADDLDDELALDRMFPLADDGGVVGPPPDAGPDEAPPARLPASPDVLDPAPEDLDVDQVPPTDWSGGATGAEAAAAEETAAPDPDRSAAPDRGPTAAVDPAPPDLDTPAGAPTDWSGGLRAAPPPDAGPPPGEARRDPLVAGEDLADAPLEPADRDRPGRTALDDDDWLPPPARELEPAIAALPGVLVGRELVKQINLYEGQEVKVISPLGQNTVIGETPYIKPYRVAGVFFTGMYEFDLKRVYVELGTLQDFLDLPDAVTGIEIRVRDPEDTDTVIAALRAKLGVDYMVQDWKELNRSLFSALKLEKIAMFLVLAIIILVASFSIVGNLIMVVIEKAREIAVLKTLGASDAGVTRIFVVQGFFIGMVGTIIGMILGLSACFLAERYGVNIPPDVYYIDRLPVHVESNAVFLVAAAGLLISVGATIYPAQIAARLRPVQGLRYE